MKQFDEQIILQLVCEKRRSSRTWRNVLVYVQAMDGPPPGTYNVR
jgi:hypothetical protein